MTNSKRIRSIRGAALAATAVVALAAAVSLLASCAAQKKEMSTSSVNVREVTTTALPPMTDISITNLHDEPSGDPSTEKVVGTIINNGDKAVSQLSIRVEAMDSSGRVLSSVTTPPLAETIAANGGQAQFSASMAKNPAATTFKAVAIAR